MDSYKVGHFLRHSVDCVILTQSNVIQTIHAVFV